MSKESKSEVKTKYRCPCDWEGTIKELIEKECLSDADKWYECPSCHRDGSTLMRLTP